MHQEGQDLVEYATLIGLIAVIIILAEILLNERLYTAFERFADAAWHWAGGKS